MATLWIGSEKPNIAAIPMAYGRTYDFTKKLRKVSASTWIYSLIIVQNRENYPIFEKQKKVNRRKL